MQKITKRGAANLDSTRILRPYFVAAAGSLRFAVCLAALVLITAVITSAQQGSAAKSERKLVTRVEPEYPAILRARQIGGTVRLGSHHHPERHCEERGSDRRKPYLGGSRDFRSEALDVYAWRRGKLGASLG